MTRAVITKRWVDPVFFVLYSDCTRWTMGAAAIASKTTASNCISHDFTLLLLRLSRPAQVSSTCLFY